MDKLTFTLKQHTPLIHFQPDQQGATLRASEVKPRLDRFILEKFGNGDYKLGAKIARANNWLNKGAEYPALEYKMKIRPTDNISIDFDRQSPFFGNIDPANDEKKDGRFTINPIKIELITSALYLFSDKFVSLSEEFFILSNIGNRASKGFGSFSLIHAELNHKPINLSLKVDRFFRNSFELTSFSTEKKTYKELFKAIDLFGKYIRSGYNMKGLYIKPLIFHYAKAKGWQWDKKSIKEKYKNEINQKYYPDKYKNDKDSPLVYSSNKTINANNPLLRSILGLATQQKWDKYLSFSTEDCEGNIMRYASALLFKPIKNDNSITVYFDWKETNVGIWKKTFITHKAGENNKLLLTVPSREEFNPDEFLKFIVRNNPRNHCNFKFDGNYTQSKIESNVDLSSHDKEKLSSLVNEPSSLLTFDFKQWMHNIGSDGFSIFDTINDKVFNGIIFQEPEKVRDFIDSFNPNELLIFDLIYKKINQKYSS